MSGFASRDLLIKKGATRIAGIQAKTATKGDEPIDVTADDDSGFRTLLGDPGTKTIDISFSGVTRDDTLRAVALGTGSMLLTDITVEYPNGDTLSGDFYFNSFGESGSSPDGAVEFEGSMQSSGEWSYTPAPS